MKVVAGVFLFLLACIDMKSKKIPVPPVILMGVVLLALRLCEGVGAGALMGGMIPGVVLLLLAILSKEKIGKGDGIVLLALGCGFGIEPVVGILGMALFFAAAVSVVLLILKKAGRKTELPFLPFLFLGYLVQGMIG